MARKVITESLKQEIIDFYKQSPVSLKVLEEKYQLSHPTISKILKDVPKHKKAQIYNPELYENYFESINTEFKAYFLGFIIADGNIFLAKDGNRQASISITVKQSDQYILERFKQEVHTNTNLAHDGRGCVTMAVRSNKMASDLAKYGIVPRKTLMSFLPNNIPTDMMCHVLRGILDGDGNVKSKQTSIRNRYAHAISYCGTKQLMEDIADYCVNVCKLKVKPTVYTYTNRHLSELKIQNKDDMYVFGEHLYHNANIYLVRKKTLYDEFKQHYGLA